MMSDPLLPDDDDPASAVHWLRLCLTEGVGAATARRLLATFGLPGQLWHCGHAQLAALVGPALARRLLAPPTAAQRAQITATLHWLQRPGHALVTLADAHYPAALLHIADPPPLLYLRGNPALLQAEALAVVGSRNATAQGVAHAARFSEELSRAGLTIVSGLALGIDAAAHEGGLRGSGSTVAVIGTGIDLDYPSRHRALAQRIAAQGCIVSEYALGTPPLAANFPRRNRIIAGLARAVLVVEAAAQSGSLITARMAAEQGRDVFAIPGSIHAPLAKGCHQLIRQGAKLVETTQDILEEFADRQVVVTASRGDAAPHRRDDDDPATARVLATMGYDPVAADTLAGRCGLEMAALAGLLLTLELQGRIELLPGAYYRRLS